MNLPNLLDNNVQRKLERLSKDEDNDSEDEHPAVLTGRSQKSSKGKTSDRGFKSIIKTKLSAMETFKLAKKMAGAKTPQASNPFIS